MRPRGIGFTLFFVVYAFFTSVSSLKYRLEVCLPRCGPHCHIDNPPFSIGPNLNKLNFSIVSANKAQVSPFTGGLGCSMLLEAAVVIEDMYSRS